MYGKHPWGGKIIETTTHTNVFTIYSLTWEMEYLRIAASCKEIWNRREDFLGSIQLKLL